MTGREEMKGEREKLRDAARRVVREYVHGHPQKIAGDVLGVAA